MNKVNLAIVASNSGAAALDQGCIDGPKIMKNSNYLAKLRQDGVDWHWYADIVPNYQLDNIDLVANLASQIGNITEKFVSQKQYFAVLGGDHSCAIGTWSGVQAAIHNQGDLGLLWIDAHLDSHTHTTSESQAIHGMPVAALLGHGDKRLTKILNSSPKIKPENVCIVGARSYEQGEQDLVKQLNLRVYYMDEIQQRGLDAVIKEAWNYVKSKSFKVGVSIDLDAIDPDDAPGVGSPEPGGLKGAPLVKALQLIACDPKLVGIEIVEFNPHRDIQQKTQKLICNLIKSMSC